MADQEIKGFAPVSKKLFVNGDIPVPQYYLDRITAVVTLQGNVFGRKRLEKDEYAVLDARVGAAVIVDMSNPKAPINPSIEYLVKNHKMRSARWTHGFPITEIDLSKTRKEASNG